MGKWAPVKYDITTSGHISTEWYECIITTYNCMTGKYGIFFPCDGVTEEFALNDDGFNIIDTSLLLIIRSNAGLLHLSCCLLSLH